MQFFTVSTTETHTVTHTVTYIVTYTLWRVPPFFAVKIVRAIKAEGRRQSKMNAGLRKGGPGGEAAIDAYEEESLHYSV